MISQISGSQNLRISESQDPRNSGSQNLRISGPQNLRILESQDLRISRSQNLRSQLSDLRCKVQIFKLPKDPGLFRSIIYYEISVTITDLRLLVHKKLQSFLEIFTKSQDNQHSKSSAAQLRAKNYFNFGSKRTWKEVPNDILLKDSTGLNILSRTFISKTYC